MQIIDVSIYFITKGHSLSCYECMGLTGSCADQKVKTCPSGSSKCMSSTAVTQNVSIKSCTVDCQNGSMNFGVVKTSYSCCDTDLCNAKDQLILIVWALLSILTFNIEKKY
uniref:UPAR/Ly6 domain-containing protein n=1 Tax=Cyprinus carpio TaxID=7962 RepID=A0A8C1RHP8_CYPCA